ncbi:hypothetical protein O6H91_09G085900 [Diphasiastrum complanatum]|uniref:Uncharacterized protein n=2 Tax=Diphasiastrum complanatum TaxID=34168 RepID=A0ACC2CRP5_DIPCM|nr:hypothetical protein O6H91_09G085900 [Diphasiastrum complanatum]
MAICTGMWAKNAIFGPCGTTITSASSTHYASSSSFAVRRHPADLGPQRIDPQMSCSASSLQHSTLGSQYPFLHQQLPASIHLGRRPLFKTTLRKGGAMSTQCSLVLTNDALKWVLTVSAASLLLLRDNGIYKQLLVPLLALQLPHDVVYWCRGEYGLWTAFLALLVRLFYYIPGELDLPLVLLLLFITAPSQVTQLRGTQAGIAISIVLAAYVAFQHFSRVGVAQGAFNRTTVVTTVAVILVVTIPLVFLFRGL